MTLTKQDQQRIEAVAKHIRYIAISSIASAGSGHPGGSLSSADYLALLYDQIIAKTAEPVVVSNGHIAAGVYATLAAFGYVREKSVVEGFRKEDSIFEGHVSREVPGVYYSTGPLGIGVSVAVGVAKEQQQNKHPQNVYVVMGDGEFQEGIVHEALHYAVSAGLENLCVFVDHNDVQLSGATKDILGIDIRLECKAAGWNVYIVDGHDISDMHEALSHFHHHRNGAPTVIIGHTVMGKGVSFMEREGKAKRSTWHGKAPTADQASKALEELALDRSERLLVSRAKKRVKKKPKPYKKPIPRSKGTIDVGVPHILAPGSISDCRTSYGHALLDLVSRNKQVVALTADLRSSVRTESVAKQYPNQHIDVGIAEQHMVAMAGGLSLSGVIPFVSTFGAFMTSRAKDQARVNDINLTNVKMVATHCGLSVGEDGPTHQAIDDMNSMNGLLQTMVMEPADANQTDHMIRYIANHYGNVYMRMGRHKYEVLTKENGRVLYDKRYKYYYGRTDVVRHGSDVVIVASGATVREALEASLLLAKDGIAACVVAASSPKHFDDDLFLSIEDKALLCTVEDHHPRGGLGTNLVSACVEHGVGLQKVHHFGVWEYQRSASVEKLYERSGIGRNALYKSIKQLVKAK